MKKIYTLSSAFIFNATGEKVDAVASPATQSELIETRDRFHFNFQTLAKKYAIYKLQAIDAPAIQGLVAFRLGTGALECTNMEICDTNKHGKPVYHGIGRAMVALCCKVSLDEGLDGCIYFDAKNRLIPYYERFGARHLFGLRMIMESANAKRLIDLYF